MFFADKAKEALILRPLCSTSSSACRVGRPGSELDTKKVLGWVANGFCRANYNIGV